MNSREEYRVIHEFDCYGKHMVVIKGNNSCHVVTMEEWRLIYGRNHQDKWDKVDRKGCFIQQENCNKRKQIKKF